MRRNMIFYLLVTAVFVTPLSALENNGEGSGLINDDWFYYPPYDNYAPNGMPDFNQRQDNWRNSRNGAWSFCGPTALSNVLWYYDSMYSNPSGTPGDGNDIYPLVQNYGAPGEHSPGPNPDDHNFNNVNDISTTWDPRNSIYGNELIERVAWYTDNDGCRTGSNRVGSSSSSIYSGFLQLIEDVNLKGFYDIIEFDVKSQNAFEDISEYMVRGSCVVLNLGFYTNSGSYSGNHWVTGAGVSLSDSRIALSDPYVDKANPTNDHLLHNDANVVSHDIYRVSTDSPFPQHSSWWLEDYVPEYAPNTHTLTINALIITRNENTAEPDKPTINGPSSGKTGNEYMYTTRTTDSDGNQLYYLFDWYDGSSSDWLGPYASGEECSMFHTWDEEGSYEITVKAKDIYGAESEWSDPLPVSMPKTYENPLWTFIEKLFDWLEHLLGKHILS